jgi:putative aldouronate transport system permease protein
MARGIRKTGEDRTVNIIVFIVSIFVLLITVYPFYYCLVVSFNTGTDALQGGLYVWPRVWTLENYIHVFKDSLLYSAFIISVLRTVIGTVTSVFITGIFAFALSHKDLELRKLYMTLLIITMYVSGGIIPYFILLQNLGLLNSFWVYIIPNLIGVFNVILMMNFFNELPPALEESARIDGANDVTIFSRIIFPMSAPIFATIALFNGVFQWNSWFDSAYYITDNSLKSLSYWLMNLINQTNLSTIQYAASQQQSGMIQRYTTQTIETATMLVIVVPIMVVYPFLQKYFVKGIMLGAVKE